MASDKLLLSRSNLNTLEKGAPSQTRNMFPQIAIAKQQPDNQYLTNSLSWKAKAAPVVNNQLTTKLKNFKQMSMRTSPRLTQMSKNDP